MRTYMRNQVINFPLSVHISWNTKGYLYSQHISSSFGWRKIDLEEVLNGYEENTDCDGTNGAYRQMKVGRNYAAMELTRPFDESGYAKLGKCVFFRRSSHKITDPHKKPQLPENNCISCNLPVDDDFSKATSVDDIGLGDDDAIESAENILDIPSHFDKFGDPVSDARSTGDFSGGMSNEVVISEIKNGTFPGPEEEVKYATIKPIH
jgi:hypothetical protein